MELKPQEVIETHDKLTATIARAFDLAGRLGKAYGIHYDSGGVFLTRYGDRWGLFVPDEKGGYTPLPQKRLSVKLKFLELGIDTFFSAYLGHVAKTHEGMRNRLAHAGPLIEKYEALVHDLIGDAEK